MKKLLFAGMALLLSNLVFSQKISGTIKDPTGEPLAGASVWLLETREGTVADETGAFALYLDKSGSYTMRASFVGYEEQTLAVITSTEQPLDIVLQPAENLLHELTVTAVRAGEKAPFTYTNMGRDALQSRNLGQDVPYLLDATPSVVVTSDAGAGIGYTGIRVRGTDASRINVTINGVPLNDAESQGVFWVDLPDVAASTESIQIQRGVGTSTNGGGAFGASINLSTDGLELKPYGEFTGTIGSFNTGKASIRLGTGLFGKKAQTEKTGFSLDARGSLIGSDGYIDRASSDLKSAYFSPSYVGKNFTLRGVVLHGHEVTYQAWYGVPAQYIGVDSLRTYNPAGTEKRGIPYDNQVDNYRQTHAQLIYNQELSRNWSFNLTGHYTRGIGFYEEFKSDQLLPIYKVNHPDDLIRLFELIRKRWLDNHFFGAVGAATYQSGQRLQLILGGGVNRYLGDHYGTLASVNGDFEVPRGHRYYENVGDKKDLNAFCKLQYGFTNELHGFMDLQLRRVNYRIEDADYDFVEGTTYFTTNADYLFFNPKAGLFYEMSKTSSLYASFAVGQKEPGRNDFVDAPEGQLPKPERLYNSELGIKYNTPELAFGLNLYHMLYRDQLVLTGNINDTGAPIRTNVPDSYRAGMELNVKAPIGQHFMADGNATFSKNKIKNFTEYIDDWDTGVQAIIEQGTTDIAFSPNAVAFGRLTWAASQSFAMDGQGFSIALAAKHVGKQFMDNTSNENTVLDAYTTLEAQVRYTLRPSFCKELSFNLLSQNLLDARYSSNAWTYRYQYSNDNSADDPYTRSEGGGFYNMTGYFPQAGRNFLLAITVKF
jgi:iron complex outermembrane receptor protein